MPHAATRRVDIDWLRIICVFLLVPFHSALIFSLNPRDVVYIKDVVDSPPLLAFAAFLNLWFMPLLFFLAGAASWFALQRRSASGYLKERISRLLVPLLFGVALLVPLMTYVHWIGRPDAPGIVQHFVGFFSRNPGDLTGVNGGFTPAHLWFILYLFILSVASLPILIAISRPDGAGVRSFFGRFFSRRGALILPFLLLAVAAAIPILGDKNPIHYLLLFLLGFIITCDDRISLAIDRDLPLYAALSAAGVAAYFVMRGIPGLHGSYVAAGIVFHFTRWVTVIACIGIGRKWLTNSGPILRHASEAAFPFYILHLPVNTIVGFWLIRYQLGIGVKYLFIVALTLLATVAVYELVVRPVPFLRVLFGVKTATPRLDAASAAGP